MLSNSLPSLVCAIAYRLYCSVRPPPTNPPLTSPPLLVPSVLTPLQNSPRPLLAYDLPRRLIFAALGHFATVTGDTLASELGILSPSKPVHLLTGAPVPPGTNGAVSLYGLAASAAGGLAMGFIMLADLVFEDMATRSVLPARGAWAMLAWGTAAGLVGSLVDSLLGATLQQTLYSTKEGRVLTDFSAPRAAGEAGVVVIGPGKNVLSNSAVNLITASIMAVAGWYVGGW